MTALHRHRFPAFWQPYRVPTEQVTVDRTHPVAASLGATPLITIATSIAPLDLVTGQRSATSVGLGRSLFGAGTIDNVQAVVNGATWTGRPTAVTSVTLAVVFDYLQSVSFFTPIATSGSASSGVGLTADTGSVNPTTLQFIRKGVAFDSLGWPGLVVGGSYFAAISWNGTTINHCLRRIDTSGVTSGTGVASGAAVSGDGTFCLAGGFGFTYHDSIALGVIAPDVFLPTAMLVAWSAQPFAILRPVARRLTKSPTAPVGSTMPPLFSIIL